jgi:hemoglobin
MNRLKTYEELGGRSLLEKLVSLFYDKVYQDPWIGKYFSLIKQEIIEVQQVDFLQGSLGGKKVYCGKLPIPAHTHMYITSELYQLRSKYFLESLNEVDACQELIERLERIDRAFYDGIVKNSITDCKKRYNTDEIVSIANPSLKNSA